LHSANIVAFQQNILMTQPAIYVYADKHYISSQNQQMHTSKLKQQNCAFVGAARNCKSLALHRINCMQCVVV